jgi:adenylate kinase
VKQRIIILLGLPGAGKGTQGRLLSEKLMIPHISTGDILRGIIEEGSKNSQMLSYYMNMGKLVPTDLVNMIIAQFISSDKCKNGCILDGYPRTLEQAQYFVEQINVVVKVVYFHLSDDVAIKRIRGRLICSSCGAIYNKYSDYCLINKNNICDNCGLQKCEARSDDDESIIRNRITEYKNKTLPLVDFYKKNSKIFTVDAERAQKKLTNEIIAVVNNI